MTDAAREGDSELIAKDADLAEPNDGACGLPFPVVGIGASAGGLAAFTRLLAKLSPTTGMAFVLIQHLDPKYGSELARLLGKDATMPVDEASDGVLLEPNHVYVIPSNAIMGFARGRLCLTPREAIRGPHLTIDHFFRALAQSCGSRSVGVVLTGTGSDGTLGLAEIKAAGGITFAQDPNTAEQAEMPRSAIAYGCVDFILSEPEIAHEIGVISTHPYLTSPADAKDHDPFNDDADAYGKILAVLMAAGGINFANYRSSTIKRRILRRMALRSCPAPADYLPLLAVGAAEVDLLLKDVLINVTNFFRDAEVFAALKALVFPELVKNRGPDAVIRLWVIGCSTGQEAYSLAIELIEYLDARPLRPMIQIFATDISEPSLLKARNGIYPDSIQAEVSPERLQRHFTKVSEGYCINKSIRDLCVFAKHDATIDTPFSRIDLLSCRNMLIYLSPTMQTRLISTFHYALNAPGFMVLGSSETTGRAADLFTAIDQKQRIYRNNHNAQRNHPPTFPMLTRKEPAPVEKPLPGAVSSLADYQRAADRLVLARYAPAGVLIDGGLNIIQFRGDTDGFLDHSRGEASLNLLKMVPYALAQTLKDAVAESLRDNTTVERIAVRFRNRDGLGEIDVRISPIRPRGAQDGCMLVLFEKHRSMPLETARPAAASPSAAGIAADARCDEELAIVRQELATANDYLKSLVEENNLVTDELKFANNEANSSNEELRCTNEELQTAKEEVLSANEELATLNEELRGRNLELTLLSNDLTNLLDSIDLPVVMLGKDLRVRRMTAAAQKTLHLLNTDIGRPVAGLNLVFPGPDLAQLVGEVISLRRSTELEVADRQGHWFTLRINPYHSEGDRITGAVVSLIGIDASKNRQERLRLAVEFSEAIVETVRDPLVVLDHELRVDTANRAFCRYFDLPREAVIGQRIYELNHGQWDIPELKSLLVDILKNRSTFDDFEISRDIPGLGPRHVLLNARFLEDNNLPSRMIVLAIADITEQKRITDGFTVAGVELLRSNAELEQFASVISHDLQEPIRMVRIYGELLQRRSGARLDDSGNQYLSNMIDGAKRMQELIKSIRDYSHVGHEQLASQPVDLNAVVRAARLNLDRIILRTDAAIDSGSLPTLIGDAPQLTQLFQNLIANALKFHAPERRCAIVIRAEESATDWIFTVADNGIGIRAEDFTRIFLLFQRLHAPGEYQGTGVGLATCKKVVERHLGTIWLTSSLGVGTTFHFSLPKTLRVPAVVINGGTPDPIAPASVPS